MDYPKPFNESVFSGFPLLETPRLVLRETRVEDEEVLLQIYADPLVRQFTGRQLFKSAEEARAWLDMIHALFPEKKAIHWAIVLKENRKYIGSIAFWRILKQHRRAEIGYDLLPACWKMGLMQEAMQAFLLFGFSKMNLHSVEANVTPENQASVNLLQKNGFVREGLFKQNYFDKDKFVDTASFSLLARNFRPEF